MLTMREEGEDAHFTGQVQFVEQKGLVCKEGQETRPGLKPLSLGKTIRAERELMVCPWSFHVLHGSQDKAHICSCMFTVLAPPPVVPSSGRNTRCLRRDWTLSPPYSPKPSTFSAEENRSFTFGFTKLSFLRFSLNPTLPPPSLTPLPRVIISPVPAFLLEPSLCAPKPWPRGKSLASMSRQQAPLAHNKESIFFPGSIFWATR